MPRGARLGLPAQVYHVISRGNNRDWVFREDGDFRKFLEIVGRYKEKYDFLLLHWVLMNNHFHFLLEVPETGSISKIMQGINLAYTLWFNRKYRRVGHLWQDRFKSILVQKDRRYLLACGRYIERNPLRAGLVGQPGDYRWSSFNAHARGQNDGLTEPYEILRGEFASRESYRDFVCSGTDSEEQDRRWRMTGEIVGVSAFQSAVRENIFAARKRRRGRPSQKK